VALPYPIGPTNFLNLADSMACQSKRLAIKMGTGAEVDTASLNAQQNIDLIMTPLNPGVVEDLLESFRDQLGKVTTYPNAYQVHDVGARALNRHVSGIDAYLTANAIRVAPEFKWALEMLAIESLDAANTFSPEVDPMDEVIIIGLDSATWTDIADIDTENYYAARLELYKITGIIPPEIITLRLLCTRWDGTIIPIDVLVDAGNPVGMTTPIETMPGEMFTAVTLSSVVCSPGSVGQQWKVISRLEREVCFGPI